MHHDRFERIKSLFTAASALLAADRDAFLDRVCAGDVDLRNEVVSLLRIAPADAIETAGAAKAFDSAAATATLVSPLREGPGTRIGPYKLLQVIGEGGYGTVFMAEQSKPVVRRVALKVIKLGMDTKQVIARFEAERQALALMDHPHIAKVLDAGETDSGRPYFVMEYVMGDPIAKFADAHNLSIRERLDLFTQVCAAVQHAHTKGVIHRDLKPGNVLVNMTDGRPFVKVIDFGIAKATGASGGRLTDKTLFTEHRTLIGTPEYMSPEQAEGSPDIDTRTDVYALGVMLYELLTGETPFDAARLRSAAIAEMQRIIKEEDPPAPSLRLSRSLDALASIAAARKIDPRKLDTTIKGELDWIVMKALEKDRQRRYESANGLMMDVQRYLAGESVDAAPPSRVYRMRKFARRNKGPLMAASAIVAVLCLGIVGVTIAMLGQRALHIEAERAKSEAVRQKRSSYQVTRFLVTTFAKAQADAVKFMSPPPTIREAMYIGVQDIDQTEWRDAETEATVRSSFASALESIGDLDAAEHQGRRAIALFEQTFVKSIEYANALSAVANTEAGRENWKQSIDFGNRALAVLDPLITQSPVDSDAADAWATVRCNIATSMYQDTPLVDTPDSLQAKQKAMEFLGETIDRGKTLSFSAELMAALKSQLVQLLALLGRDDEAEPLLRSAMAEFDRVNPSHPTNATTRRILAEVVDRHGATDEAETLFAKAIAIQRLSLNPTMSTDLADTYQAQGDFLSKHNRADEAVESYKAAAVIWDNYKDRWFQKASAHLKVIAGLNAANRLRESEELALQTIADCKANMAPDSWVTAYMQGVLADILTKQARFAEAEAVLQQLVPPDQVKDYIRRLTVNLYEAWEKAEPGKGYQERANAFRSPPQTQPSPP